MHTCFFVCFAYTNWPPRRKRCVHLTNYSVNKKNQKFVAPGSSCQDSSSNSNSNQRESSSGSGDGSSSTNSAAQAPHASKWSLGALREHIERDRGPGAWQRVWRQVHDIVAGAVLAAETRISTEVKMKVPHRNICFEVRDMTLLPCVHICALTCDRLCTARSKAHKVDLPGAPPYHACQEPAV